jgi:hypothetical protein
MAKCSCNIIARNISANKTEELLILILEDSLPQMNLYV